jgi:hypothetical protein
MDDDEDDKDRFVKALYGSSFMSGNSREMLIG